MNARILLSLLAMLISVPAANAADIPHLKQCTAEEIYNAQVMDEFESRDKSKNYIANALTSIDNTVNGSTYLKLLDGCVSENGFYYQAYDAVYGDAPRFTHLKMTGVCESVFENERYEEAVIVIFTLDLNEEYSGEACYYEAG